MKKHISITIDERLLLQFQNFCKMNGMKVSSKIELMVRDFLKQNIQNQGKNWKK